MPPLHLGRPHSPCPTDDDPLSVRGGTRQQTLLTGSSFTPPRGRPPCGGIHRRDLFLGARWIPPQGGHNRRESGRISRPRDPRVRAVHGFASSGITGARDSTRFPSIMAALRGYPSCSQKKVAAMDTPAWRPSSRWREGAASQKRLLTGANPLGYGPVSGWGGLRGSSGPTGAMTAGRRPGRSEGGQDVRLSVPRSPPQPLAGQRQKKAGSGLKALLP